jgi:molybdenum cofactor cytidylyltransferase
MPECASQLPIAAVVAAAGFSRRMGRLKQLLPWGEGRTVIAAVVESLAAAGAEPVLCVVGHRCREVQAALQHTPARIVYNEDYSRGEMLSSYQAGIVSLSVPQVGDPVVSMGGTARRQHGAAGAMLALGDQPHIPVEIIRLVLDRARASLEKIVIPSYDMRRGHPLYLPRRLWPELLGLEGGENLRHLLRRHQDEIVYVNVSTDAILRDMDTPADYDAIWQGKKPEE